MTPARRTGSANLPLHGGKAPSWLFGRNAALGGSGVERRERAAALKRLTKLAPAA